MSALQILAVTILVTAALWLPYVLERVVSGGLIPALGDPINAPEPAAWARRAKAAHANALANLTLFAPSILVAELSGHGGDAIVTNAAMAYLVLRVLHYLVYTAGIPGLRTLTFFGGWIATLIIAAQVLL